LTINIRPEINTIKDEIINLRRHIHQHPELGYEEHNTAKLISDRLFDYGIEVSTGIGKTGVVGLLHGNDDGHCIGLRADMDALPIQETGDLPFKSVNDSVMHACGHDGHVAMLLGAAKVLSEKKDQLKGSVKFIFQPAEEGGFGARAMIEDAVLENPTVDEMYGIHLWNYQPFGTIGVQAGPVLAAADIFSITITGKGGHGAAPHTSVDAIVVASQLINALQTIVSRNINPLESGVVSIGKINGGHNFNIIADKVILRGTARAYSEEIRQMIKNRMEEIISGISSTFGAKIQLDYQDGYPATINSEIESEKVKESAMKILPDGVQKPYLSMGGEDFAYYLQKVRGCFFFVGSSPDEVPLFSVPHHCSHYNINEDALLIGASVFVQLIEDNLIQ
tara:strand:- start:9676 stop:10854 length:1179 start_codon:yes stop_codon:yes gene_type:complete